MIYSFILAATLDTDIHHSKHCINLALATLVPVLNSPVEKLSFKKWWPNYMKESFFLAMQDSTVYMGIIAYLSIQYTTCSPARVHKKVQTSSSKMTKYNVKQTQGMVLLFYNTK